MLTLYSGTSVLCGMSLIFKGNVKIYHDDEFVKWEKLNRKC